MPNHLQDLLTTNPKPGLTKEEQEVENKMVSLQAMSIVNTLAFPMVLKAALELGVIDTIAAASSNGAWLSPSEIAVSLPTKPTNPEALVLLDRMLLLLVSHSILKCRVIETRDNRKVERVYAAESVCRFFLKDSDGSGSLFSLFLLSHSQVYFKTWTKLKDVILEGKDAFNSAHDMGFFDYNGSDEQFAEVFHRAMSEYSTLVMKQVLEVYRGFENVNILVDVGGGNGTILGLIISKHPHIKGVNFDLAQTLTHAPFYPGVEHVSGDMFKTEIPKGDAIFMKWILHNWTDEDCKKILENCWKNLPEKGKVIIVEMITPMEPNCGDVTVFAMDLCMLTQCSGGKERSLSQFESLAFESGFVRCEIICVTYPYSVIEFHK